MGRWGAHWVQPSQGGPEPASRARPPPCLLRGLPTLGPAAPGRGQNALSPGGSPGVGVKARVFSLWNRQGSRRLHSPEAKAGPEQGWGTWVTTRRRAGEEGAGRPAGGGGRPTPWSWGLEGSWRRAWVASDTPEGGQNWALGAGLRQTWKDLYSIPELAPGPPLPTLGLRARRPGLGSVPGRLLSFWEGPGPWLGPSSQLDGVGRGSGGPA